MMIFSLTLTANQIRALRAVESYVDKGDHQPMIDMTLFVPGAKTLIREGIIVQVSKPHPHYQITEKGRLVLQLVEADVKDFLKQIEAPAPAATERPAGKRRKSRVS